MSELEKKLVLKEFLLVKFVCDKRVAVFPSSKLIFYKKKEFFLVRRNRKLKFCGIRKQERVTIHALYF
jgi:hypothetical protein